MTLTSNTSSDRPGTASAASSGLVFPTGFLWGSATAAYQVEGAAGEDGRVPSIWDTFCRVPGAVVGGDNGDVAADHYHRYADDVDLMAGLGLQAYRFSTAWPRIMPEQGRVNDKGLDFYDRLVDALLAKGIEPWLTLYHWDLPQHLEDRGGWTNRDVADWFTEYALATHARLGDRVTAWSTLNEPWCSAYLGYAGGQHAPGRQEPQAAVSAAHHLLLAHGRATQALRAADAHLSLGIVLNMSDYVPVDPGSPADVAAADRHDALFNRLFAPPVFTGRYDDVVLTAYAEAGVALPVRDGDLEVISTPLDYLGLNFYTTSAISAVPPTGDAVLPDGASVERPTSNPLVGADGTYVHARDLPRTAQDWEVEPDGLRRLLLRVHRDWTGPAGIPVYVTENGSSYDDVVLPDGSIQDTERVAYLRDHLAAVHRAIEEGADVRGYFAWSLMDNLEWAYGYAKRFGIVHVDFETQVRTPKASAHLFSQVARTNTLPDTGTFGA